jgi:hypothetical protein
MVGEYPILAHTLFIDHNRFKVEVTRGIKNATKNRWPVRTPVWFTFESVGVDSHHEAARQGFNIASLKLKEEIEAVGREFSNVPRSIREAYEKAKTKEFIELENSLLIKAQREEYRKVGEAHWKGVTQVTPIPEPEVIVWAASIKTPNGKWNPVFMSKNRDRVCVKGKAHAIRSNRTIKIHKV